MIRAVFGILLFMVLSMNLSYALLTTDVVQGYSNCQLNMGGNNTSTASVRISYKATEGRTGGMRFLARGVLFYAYSPSGFPIPIAPDQFYMGAVTGNKTVVVGNAVMLYDVYWTNKSAYFIDMGVIFKNHFVLGWPGVTIQAVNVTPNDIAVADTQGVYISYASKGSCQRLSDPNRPPARDITVTVTAPDWDLGEIKSGEQVIPFSASSDSLCLQYTGADVANKQFIINASSQNGTVNNQYQLKGLQDNTQSIPYQLMLDNGSNKITLPNSALTTVPLLTGGKTCFLPTFRTFALKSIKKGDYSDVLTFTVATKA